MQIRFALLRDELLIAEFVGTKPPPHAMELWLQTLNQEIRGSMLILSQNVGKGYFLLAGNEKEALHNALMLFPFRATLYLGSD